jgi:AcrR family transcriptional regulator
MAAMVRKRHEQVLTKRGAATRQRIVETAARLVYEQGARGTSLDDVMERTGVSKSQLYHYFENKDALLRAVIQWQTKRIIGAQAGRVRELDSFGALKRWGDMVVASVIDSGGRGGCPLGSLASELADYSEKARILLGESFNLWEAEIVRGLNAMKARGELDAAADPQELATAAMTALQGGKLLAQTQRSARPLRLAMDMAIGNIQRHLKSKRGARQPR